MKELAVCTICGEEFLSYNKKKTCRKHTYQYVIEEYNRLRALIYKRDGYVCRYCGQKSIWLEPDHVLPKKSFGIHHPNNLVTSCHACNSKKFIHLLSKYQVIMLVSGNIQRAKQWPSGAFDGIEDVVKSYSERYIHCDQDWFARVRGYIENKIASIAFPI
jgi:hypothetical protein